MASLWCQYGAMDLEPYIEEIHRQLTLAAEASGEEARALADRLAAPLDAAIRLALQDALSAAAEEITVELAPGSVELRLRGRTPEFVVTPPPADPTSDDADVDDASPAALPAADGDEGAVARINLRLPEYLKERIERAAAGEGLSVNSWCVRTSAAALERGEGTRRRERPTPHGAQRYTGWAR
jgi:HicB family